ncbi:Mth938-like domain-containing protein [Chloroflexota bacterium]
MIDSYHSGEISVDGVIYNSDIIVLPDRVISWWRKQSHNIDPGDLDDISRTQLPEVIVIGSGEQSLMVVPESIRNWLESKGMKVIIANTDKACEVYNHLCSSQKVVAALHLTC